MPLSFRYMLLAYIERIDALAAEHVLCRDLVHVGSCMSYTQSSCVRIVLYACISYLSTPHFQVASSIQIVFSFQMIPSHTSVHGLSPSSNIRHAC
jgi:hypothetical protein